jgi:hypothetical protein
MTNLNDLADRAEKFAARKTSDFQEKAANDLILELVARLKDAWTIIEDHRSRLDEHGWIPSIFVESADGKRLKFHSFKVEGRNLVLTKQDCLGASEILSDQK